VPGQAPRQPKRHLQPGRGADGDRAQHSDELTVQIQASDMRALSSIAEKNGIAVESLVRDIVSGWLKYR